MDLVAWDSRIDAFYTDTFDESDPQRSVAAMRELLDVMQTDHAGAFMAFELAGVRDSLGLEDEAVPLYREALAAGLDADHEARARIQLASTLRNLGRLDEARELLAVPAAAAAGSVA